MSQLGDALRALQRRYGMRQEDLGDALGLSRSSIANIQSGRQGPSLHLWQRLTERFPDDVDWLRPAYESARQAQEQSKSAQAAKSSLTRRPPQPSAPDFQLGGPFVIDQYDITYVFRESRSPEEILEIRWLRALSRADSFGLMLSHTTSENYRVQPEVLWGGSLVSDELYTPEHKTLYLRRLEFDRHLRRNDTHSFCLRYWVERDEPDDQVIITMTIPAKLVRLHVNFWGNNKPDQCWRYGPLPDEALAPGEVTNSNRLTPNRAHGYSASFAAPEVGTYFGVAWEW